MNPKTPQPEPGVPAPDTTPPGEETQEIFPDAPLDDDDLLVEDKDKELEGEGGNGGEKYDGGEIPPAPADVETVE